jgi:hypothetical protein
MILGKSPAAQDLSQKGNKRRNKRQLNQLCKDGCQENSIRRSQRAVAGDTSAPEWLTERKAHEYAGKDTGEETYDDDADVEPCEARLVEVAGRGAFVRGAEITFIRRLDRRGASQPLGVSCVHVLLVVVCAGCCLPGAVKHSTGIVKGVEAFAPQYWCILVGRVPREVVGEGVRGAGWREGAGALDRRGLGGRYSSAAWYGLYADSAARSNVRRRLWRCYAQPTPTWSPERVCDMLLLVILVYRAWRVPLGGRIALAWREIGARGGWTRWGYDVCEPTGVGAAREAQARQCRCAFCRVG